MTTYHWINATGGSFDDQTGWSPTGIPGSADIAIIDAAGGYTVVSSANNTVASLVIIATATLDITAGTFSVANGTTTGGLAGTVIVGDNAILELGGTIVNSGTIGEQAAADATRIIITSAAASLSGGGHVTLSASANNYIYASSGADVLTNVDNTIAGGGNLGDGQLTLVNQAHGTIDANQAAAALALNTGSATTTNLGLLEATAGGGLVLDSAVLNTGGTIEASGAGSTVTLANNVIGGTLKSLTGGVLVSAGGSGQLDGQSSHAVTLAGSLVIADNTSFYIAGTINDTGAINVASTADSTNLIINSPTVELKGGGQVTLSDNVNNRIYGSNSGFTLYNLGDTIAGAGQIGLGQTKIINAGTIDANQAASLTVNPSYVMTNTGLLEATAAGGLTLLGLIDNQGGTILAGGGGDAVTLDGAIIEGGTLNTAGGGEVVGVANGQLYGLNFGQIVNLGAFSVADNNSFYLQGTIDNVGSMVIASGTNDDTTNLIANSQIVTLTGGGTIAMTDETNNRLYAASGNERLVNVNNTISGAGQLGAGQMVLINQAAGIIDANGLNALVLNTGAQIATNTGLIEATGTAAGNGGLVILSSVVNAGGTIAAKGANAHVDLSSGATVEGGTLAAAAGGVINDINSAGLDGSDYGLLTLQGTFDVENNANLSLYGALDNTGRIAESGGANTTNIIVNSQAVTLTGSGQVLMTDSANNRLYGVNGSVQLVNVNNTISGAGQIGVGQLNLVNQAAGVIDATGTNALVLGTGADLIFNTGIIESTSAGGLVLQNSAVDNAGGTVEAVGAGSHVDLSGGTVQGGTVLSSGGGVIDTAGGNGALDGNTAGALTIVGTVVVTDNTSLYLSGTIDNTGSIVENAGTDSTNILLNSQTVFLTGGGQLQMANSTSNRIYANSNSSQTLDNVNETISGAGQIGLGDIQLVNAATILANASAGMTINTGGGNLQNLASGLIESTGAGSILFSGGILSNQGTIEAAGGSTITMNSGVVNANVATGELTGGVWEAIGANSILAIDGGAVTTLSADVILQSVGSTLETGNGSTFANLENTLTSISAAGVLTLNGARGYVTSLNLADSGHIALNGGLLQTGKLTIGGSGSVAGFGSIKGTTTNNGTLEALGGKLKLFASVTGSGALQVGAGSTLELGIGAKQTTNFLSASGVLLLDKPAGFVNQHIGGLQIGDTIDLGLTAVGSAVVNGSTLTVTTTGNTVYKYQVAGALVGNHFAIGSDGAGGSDLVLSAGTLSHAAFGAALAAAGQGTLLSDYQAPAIAGGAVPAQTIGAAAGLFPSPPPVLGFSHAAH